MSRPSSAHRLSMSSAASNGRQSAPRQHVHSLSSGSLNPTHRVTRRKSMSSTAVNNAAAMAIAVREADAAFEAGGYSSKRNNTSKVAGVKGGNTGSYPAFPSSLPSHAAVLGATSASAKSTGIAVTDGPSISSVEKSKDNKARLRRASEGSRLSKNDAKKTATSDLKCEKCGKGYKHSSCLTKHLSVSLLPPLSCNPSLRGSCVFIRLAPHHGCHT